MSCLGKCLWKHLICDNYLSVCFCVSLSVCVSISASVCLMTPTCNINNTAPGALTRRVLEAGIGIVGFIVPIDTTGGKSDFSS